MYVGQTGKVLKNLYFERKEAFQKPTIYKINFASHAINNEHSFLNT